MKLEGILKTLLLAVVSILLFASAVFAASTGPAAIDIKKGILFVTFGSSMPQGEAAIIAVRDAVIAAYPDIEVRTAYTSRIIMRKIAREQGRSIDEPAIALAKMAYEGFTDVAVLSTHIIPGAEYDDLAAVVRAFRMMSEYAPKPGFRKITLSLPLLSEQESIERVAEVMANTYEKEIEDGAVVLVGHGTHHFADAAYSALQMALLRQSPNFYVGVIEGLLEYDDVLSRLKKSSNGNVLSRLRSSDEKRIYIAPAMLVAGDHTLNDIAGDEEDSWKSMLEDEGYEVIPILTGWGQNEGIQEIILDKLHETWSELDK